MSNIVNLTTVVEGDLKVPFPIATTLYTLTHFTLGPYLVMLCV